MLNSSEKSSENHKPNKHFLESMAGHFAKTFASLFEASLPFVALPIASATLVQVPWIWTTSNAVQEHRRRKQPAFEAIEETAGRPMAEPEAVGEQEPFGLEISPSQRVNQYAHFKK